MSPMLKIDRGEVRAAHGVAAGCVNFKAITWPGLIALFVRPGNESSNEENRP
jgi:hypothetical protein